MIVHWMIRMVHRMSRIVERMVWVGVRVVHRMVRVVIHAIHHDIRMVLHRPGAATVFRLQNHWCRVMLHMRQVRIVRVSATRKVGLSPVRIRPVPWEAGPEAVKLETARVGCYSVVHHLLLNFHHVDGWFCGVCIPSN